MAQPAIIPYTTLITFHGEHGRVTAMEPGNCVGAMWNIILLSIFPIDRFSRAPRARNPGGCPDIIVSDWTEDSENNLVPHPFLVVQTTKAPSDGRPMWKDAERQLKRYLRGHAQMANTGRTGRARLYGAVAIGTDVKFYTYNRRERTVKMIRGQRRAYDVLNDANMVSSRLGQIMNNH
ncbi:hypothetical protein BJX99DRAFT_225882 [Aspergillus californicus]